MRGTIAMLIALCVGAAACDFARSARPLSPPPSPSAAASEATFVNGGDCAPARDPALPGGAGCATTAEKGSDRFTVYAILDANDRPKQWRMRLTTTVSVIDRGLNAGNAYSYPRAIGGADVDGDAVTEWFVKVADFTSHGAPWSSMNLFFVHRDRLRPLTYDGRSLAINYGGISRLGEGATCADSHLILLRAEARNRRNTRWTVSERMFKIDRARAQLVRRTENLLVISDYNDPDLDPYYELDCSGLVYPPP